MTLASVTLLRKKRVRPWVTVSGSFNRHLKEVALAIEELKDLGAIVLSPRNPKAHSEIKGGFLLLDGDVELFHEPTIRATQDRHNSCIALSDFLWIVSPEGYVGNSTAGEIGVARVTRVPMYTSVGIWDLQLMFSVTLVPNIKTALCLHVARQD